MEISPFPFLVSSLPLVLYLDTPLIVDCVQETKVHPLVTLSFMKKSIYYHYSWGLSCYTQYCSLIRDCTLYEKNPWSEGGNSPPGMTILYWGSAILPAPCTSGG